jgi:zinc D-Ala-D-Ala carboxypeptidase
VTSRTFANATLIPDGYWRWPNFTPHEIACHGDGTIVICEEAMDALQKLRTEYGKPMRINSAYRSPVYNKEVGGEANSYHLKGMAFDVSLEGMDVAAFLSAAMLNGFNGIGFYNTFIHIDIGPDRQWNKRTLPNLPEMGKAYNRKPLLASRTVKGIGLVAGSSLLSAVKNNSDDVNTSIDTVQHVLQFVQSMPGWVLLAGVAIGLAYAAYARYDDWKKWRL